MGKEKKPTTIKVAGEYELKAGVKLADISAVMAIVRAELGKLGTGDVKLNMTRGIVEF